jgi:hypothetical protein
MTGDEVERPSYHSWSIAQVLSHLGSGAEILRLRLAGGFPVGSSPGDDEIHPIWDRWERESVPACRSVTRWPPTTSSSPRSPTPLPGRRQLAAGPVRHRAGPGGAGADAPQRARAAHLGRGGGPRPARRTARRRGGPRGGPTRRLVAWTGRPQPGLQVRVETTGAERVFLLTETGERAGADRDRSRCHRHRPAHLLCRPRRSSGWSTAAWTPTTRRTESRPTVSTSMTCGRSSPCP